MLLDESDLFMVFEGQYDIISEHGKKNVAEMEWNHGGYGAAWFHVGEHGDWVRCEGSKVCDPCYCILLVLRAHLLCLLGIC